MPDSTERVRRAEHENVERALGRASVSPNVPDHEHDTARALAQFPAIANEAPRCEACGYRAATIARGAARHCGLCGAKRPDPR